MGDTSLLFPRENTSEQTVGDLRGVARNSFLTTDDFTEITDDHPISSRSTRRKHGGQMRMSLVKEGMYIGTRADARNLANARLPGDILRILTVDIESLQIEEDGVLTKHVSCLDEPEADLLSFFDDCSEFITSGLKNKQNVIVHWWVKYSRKSNHENN